jgi:L-asparaginase
MARSKPRVLVLALGGTIAMTRNEGAGIAPHLDAADLVAAVPGLEDLADIVAESPLQLPGASLTIENFVHVAQTLIRSAAEGISGAVVVQGTDTIEESAFVLDCLDTGEMPVVVTGAMRGPQAAGADGPGNLLAAVTVAASSEAYGMGVLVVLNDTVHSAAFVRKGHTGLPSSFTSRPFGPAGYVVEGEFIRVAPTRVRQEEPLSVVRPVPPVALVTLGLGDDGRLIEALPNLGFSGAVIAGMGVGHAPVSAVDALSNLAANIPTVLASRVPEGPTFKRTYGFPGSERDLLGRGLISSGWLAPIKARLLLSLLLASANSGEIPPAFSRRTAPMQLH